MNPRPFAVLTFSLFLAAQAWPGGKKPAAPGPAAPVPPPSAAEPRPAPAAVEAAPALSASRGARPVYLAELPSLHDYSLFANGGGWDGNWYVGYDKCWISKLPAPPPGEYKRAFLGAKLGRMKTAALPGRPPWEKASIAGEVDIAVASEPLWPQSRRFLLTPTQFIPLEGDPENAVEGVGESRWFWVEVPLKTIDLQKESYVAVFSPSEALSDAQHAPVLAAGWGDTRTNTWLTSSGNGAPPFNAGDALKTPVTYFDPGIAIKLVPPNDYSVGVTLIDPPAPGAAFDEKLTLSASIEGSHIQGAWVEFSTDTRTWKRTPAAAWAPPYVLTVKKAHLPAGRVRLRVAAADEWENRGYGPVIELSVPAAAPPAKKPKK